MEKIKQRSMLNFVLSSIIIGVLDAALSVIIMEIIIGGFWAIVFSLLLTVGMMAYTVNMYRVYFYYRMSLDINAVCEGDGYESESYLMAIVLSLLTFGIYGVYWRYKLAQRLHVNAPRYGFKMMETGKDIVILGVLSGGYISAWELIKNMNRVAKVYNQNGLAEVGGVQ